MKKTPSPRFSSETLAFLLKAGKQKSPTWLERNRADYERLLQAPLQHLASELKRQLTVEASGYHFPQKGIGRLRRPAHRVAERGGGLYKDWMAYSASRPSGSRFDHNPNLFFLINPDDDEGDGVLVAGGLYMPSSRQIRQVREALAEDTSKFERLFATPEFKRRFKGGFSREKVSTRPPRGFDPNHRHIEWLKLQAFFVWKSYKKSEFSSPRFCDLVAGDFKQILKMNDLLEEILSGRSMTVRAKSVRPSKGAAAAETSSLLDRLADIEPVRRFAQD